MYGDTSGVVGFLCFLGFIAAAVYMILSPESVGEATGGIGRSHVTRPTPPWMVRYAGCLMLAALPGAGLGNLAHSWIVGALAALALATGIYKVVGRFWPMDG